MEYFLKKRFAIILSLFALASCSKANDVPSISTTGSTTGQKGSNSVIYPHSDEFKKTAAHGQAFLSDKMACVKCHGSDYQGGATKVSCYGCHSVYPHPVDWPLPTKHGATFEGLDDDHRKQCMLCHTGPTTDNPAAACKFCHAAYPHSDDFKGGGDDHPTLARTWAGKCSICHTDLTRNLPNLGTCRVCHTEGNPEMHWVKPTPDPGDTSTSTSTTTSTSTSTSASTRKKPGRALSSARPHSTQF